MPDSPAPNPANPAVALDTAGWDQRLAELQEMDPADALTAAESLLSDLEQGLQSL